ncbi:hypothetical protein SAMN05216241_101387 [Limimonas halophila]|uniref:Uncharacterized protein n=1 Tax=Limimonas halophila TaxID=1082479 RepID=A0A1G7LVD0_9PROT|nr:hypothetical protein [Limimonas halophila]SDF53403.1 hypothetical protein SAMN05216241_101387 [Limimonas halophila]
MTPDTCHTHVPIGRPDNDNDPSRRKPDLVTERDAIATLLKDGFSLAQASEIWRILVRAESEGARARQADAPDAPD